MNRYPEYKKSGFAWLPEIPSHWYPIPAKALFSLRNERAREDDEQLTASQKYGVIEQKRFMELENQRVVTVQKDFSILKHVEPGDFVISMRSFQGGLEYSNVRGCISSAYVMLIPNKEYVYEPFYRWLFKSDKYINALQSTSNLVRDGQALRYSNFSQVRLFKVPIDEQIAIAKYLDDKCSKIEEYIKDAQMCIEDYKLLKLAIIEEVVTKGLRAEAVRESGLEWIKNIPNSWKTNRLKSLFVFGKGLPITKDNLVKDGIPVISYGQIHSKTNTGTSISKDLIRYVPEGYLESNPDSLVHRGDILLADTSEDVEGCGNAVYVDTEMQLFAGYHTIILHSIISDNNKYLAYLFKAPSWRSQIRRRVAGVKLFSVSKKLLNNVSVILPSIEEQDEIVRYLDKKCELIDGLICEKTKQIEELEQFKKLVISEVVTGKRKVV